MKYLVHETTKEHVIWESGMPTSAPGYKCVEADEEGWIPWNGGECPLPASNQAEVKLQDGKQGNFDSIPLMTHRSWQKWNCGGDIIAYRPILAEKEEHGEHFKAYGAHMKASEAYIVSENVFDRLRQATEAADSIPAILAEINALLPEGYCVAKRSTVNEAHIEGIGGVTLTSQPAEDMSDWRNWRRGDVLTCVERYLGEPGFKFGEQYTIKMIDTESPYENFNRIGIELDSAGSSLNAWQPKFFRFHSRPAKVAE